MSDSIRDGSHHVRRAAHQRGYWRGQRYAASRFGLLGVACLVGFHLLHDRATGCIVFRQFLQMAIQVRFDLALRFDHETKADRITDQSGNRANRPSTPVPNWIQQARPAVEFTQSLPAPGKVICFFRSRIE